MSNIEIFKETLDYIQNRKLLFDLTQTCEQNTIVYSENFKSEVKTKHKKTDIYVNDLLTLMVASRIKNRRVAVLNFANPIEPGGGVFRGANAQEEYLCRASNLYYSLDSIQASEYYSYHEKLLDKRTSDNFMASDRIIYSEDVTVIRIDEPNFPTDKKSVQKLIDNWYQVDVITCAAPYITNPNIVDELKLELVFESRIKNIFETAIEHHVDVLILGAFGCGAFNNSPKLVAGAFRDILNLPRYKNTFEKVVFAIKRKGKFCENIEAFELAFYELSAERNKRRFFE